MVAAAALWRVTAADPFVSLVEEIARTPQSYDGEMIDKLAALGPAAVPAIGSVLREGPQFPLVFVRALERIGDGRGTQPVLELISAQAPYSSSDRSALTTASILALRSMRNATACAPLVSILRDESAHARVRLASASASASLCSGDVGAEGRRFIMQTYEDRARYLDPKEGLSQRDVYLALMDVDNEESRAILLEVVDTAPARGPSRARAAR
jgi:hypothetical protein